MAFEDTPYNYTDFSSNYPYAGFGGNPGFASISAGLPTYSGGSAAAGSGVSPTNGSAGAPLVPPRARTRIEVCNTPDGSCPGSGPGPGSGGGASVTGTDALVTGSVNDLFVRAIIVILGFIFVAMGLRSFGGNAVAVIPAPLRSTAHA